MGKSNSDFLGTWTHFFDFSIRINSRKFQFFFFYFLSWINVEQIKI